MLSEGELSVKVGPKVPPVRLGFEEVPYPCGGKALGRWRVHPDRARGKMEELVLVVFHDEVQLPNRSFMILYACVSMTQFCAMSFDWTTKVHRLHMR